jgi:hypothetical protein
MRLLLLCSSQAVEVATLKTDNVKLYEKIKYLRAYGQSSMQVWLGTGCVYLLAALAGFAFCTCCVSQCFEYGTLCAGGRNGAAVEKRVRRRHQPIRGVPKVARRCNSRQDSCCNGQRMAVRALVRRTTLWQRTTALSAPVVGLAANPPPQRDRWCAEAACVQSGSCCTLQ